MRVTPLPFLSALGLVLVLGLVAVAGAGACSSSSSATPSGAADAGVDGAGDGAVGYPAPHPAMPVAQSLGGPVMKSVKVVALSFMGDPLQGKLDTFVSELAAASTYWAGTTAEYGVGALSAAPPMHLAETAPGMQSDAQLQTWLSSKITAGGGFPQPDDTTQYVVFFPSGAKVTTGAFGMGGTLCQELQGYHASYALAGKNVIYSVIGRCPPPVANLADIDEVTAEASHEIMEAATDPLPSSMPAYAAVDEADSAWALVGGGGELGDLCAALPGVFYRTPGVDDLVQRTWSNAAAAAGRDPCQPSGASPYFNSAPVLPDMVDVTGSPIGSFKGKGVKIAIGQEKTIELDLYSDGPTSGPWTVEAIDLNSQFFGGPQALAFTFDKTSGQNGDKIQLTIKALAAGVLGAAPFWIQNTLGGTTTIWTGLVAQ